MVPPPEDYHQGAAFHQGGTYTLEGTGRREWRDGTVAFHRDDNQQQDEG